MSFADLVFGAAALTALGGALLATLPRNIFHNILGFALAMLGVGGVFLSLGSDFLAVVFVLVYVGAVAIAMVYAVMLSQPLDMPARPRRLSKVLGAAALAAALAGALALMLRSGGLTPMGAGRLGEIGAGGLGEIGAAEIGRRLLTDYVLAFELISVLLLIAMMGAVMVARRTGEGRGTW